jgi:plasmid stability protein
MATLTIRNLPDDVHNALRRQAAEHRRSMEAEAREVLRTGVARKPTEAERKQAVAELQAMGAEIKNRLPEGWSLVDELIAERRLEAAWESGRVTSDERSDQLTRLHRHEIWPKDVESFALSRLDTKG